MKELDLSLSLGNVFKEMADYIIEVLSQKMVIVNGANGSTQPPKLYNNKQACEYLGVCSKTLQNYRDSGMIEFSQTGRKILYTQENLNAFLAKNKMEVFNN